ncbi:MAG: flagellar hook-associated protein FlgK [Alphaproteobacteria bacterium]
MTLTSALRIATGGMQYAQAGLGTVSHNITNANTTGFTRQVQQGEAVSYNGFGAGVDLSVIQRITDRFLENRSLNAVSDLDYATTRRTQLDNVEGAFSNASADGGLDDLVNKTFAAMSQLANSPADGALRRNAMQSAVLLTDTIRNVNADLDTIQTLTDEQITDELVNANDLIKRVYDLNREIALQNASNVGGGNTNDLQDARDNAVKELSKLFGISVTQTGDSSLRVLTESGRKLLDESSYVQLKRAPGSGTFGDVVSQNVKVDGSLDANEVPLYTNNLSTGRIKALIDIRDTTVPNMLAELDEFATTLMSEFNKISSRGSSIPPVASLTSANTLANVATTSTDLFTSGYSSLAGSTFDVSIVNSQGTVISTTVGTASPVTFAGSGPYTLADFATTINGNAVLGNVALNTTNTSPGVLGVTSITTNGTVPNGTYTIRRIDATHVALYNAANTAVVAGTSTIAIVQPASGTQTLNFGQGVVITTNSTLNIASVTDNASAGTITLGATNGVTATATVNGSGEPYLQLQTLTAGQYLVISNRSGDALGTLGMNTFFSGTDSNDIAVKAAIQTNPDLIPVALMRASDGGLSSLDGRSALAMAQMADTRVSFSSAGGLGAQSTTTAGYVGQMISDLAIISKDAKSRESFTESLTTQIDQLKSSLSGVNVNEELSQMLIYQNSFQSSARIIQVVNDLFDSLLTIIR